jgi:hypothetical protein
VEGPGCGRGHVVAGADCHDWGMPSRDSSEWTSEEEARELRAREHRVQADSLKTAEERLEETLRLSRFMSELQQGAARDVQAR